MRGRLAEVLEIPKSEISFSVSGINHLPILNNLIITGRNGKQVLRGWIAKNGLYALTNVRLNTIRDIFHDRLAVKLALFESLDVVFGAGDRHLAEFFPGFLTEAAEFGGKYGLILTTIEQRQELMDQRRRDLESYVSGESREWVKSEEQLAPLMASLLGGPTGEFVINIPNPGQIPSLPHDVVVECSATVDDKGVHPHSLGEIPSAVKGVIVGHIACQELIVEAALTGERQPALAALATDPLVTDPTSAGPMLDEFMRANAKFME